MNNNIPIKIRVITSNWSKSYNIFILASRKTFFEDSTPNAIFRDQNKRSKGTG